MSKKRKNKACTYGGAVVLLLVASALFPQANAAEELLPLPGSVFPRKGIPTNPIFDLTDRLIETAGKIDFEIPNNLSVESENGTVTYDAEKKHLLYESRDNPLQVKADNGLDVQARSISAELDKKRATLVGPLSIYHGETFSRADRGTYHWESKDVDAYNVRAKAQGLIIRSTHVEYRKDEEGKTYAVLHDAFVSTDDVEEPSSWIGAGELTVHPGDSGELTRLSIASGDYDIPVPIFGWFTISHSLNPEEGYLPIPGSKSIWGGYLLNRYGILLGNRHAEKGMPVADYVLTTRLDYRTRRGVAGGFDVKDSKMKKLFDKKGLSFYFIQDENPDITPTRRSREDIDNKRYRIALEAMWDMPTTTLFCEKQEWTAQANINILSDRYVLRDFFEELSMLNNTPDNIVNMTGKSKMSQIQLWGRFAPNNYYSTDERVEFSYYRVRSELGKSGITYETRNSASIMRQYLPLEQRISYQNKLNTLKNKEMIDYYSRLLNTSAYTRLNSTHEFSTNFHVFDFLNVTPKTGVGYTGYYEVDNVGSDNRFLGYIGCDLDIKVHKKMPNIRVPWLYGKGLTHVIRPYATFSHCNLSSSNPRVPRLDASSMLMGDSFSNPINLDLIGFSNIDGWGTWTIWRMGVSNCLTTSVDGATHTILNWNLFLDYNVENPNTKSDFSNLRSCIAFRPTQHCTLTLETQTPSIQNGDGFTQYSANLSIQPTHWFEYTLGYSYISDHPLIKDASQATFRAIIRLNERNCLAGRWDWAIEESRFPIQQYGYFRKVGPWYVGTTIFMRDNGGKKETGFGLSFTLEETGTALPVELF